MSEQTQTVDANENKNPITDKGSYILEENVFSGQLEGLKYNVLQFKNESDEDAANSLKLIVGDNTPENPGKWKTKQVIAILNSAVRSAMRVKAQQEILSLDKDKQPQEIVKRLQHNPILFSADDAEKWVPGERELTIQGKMRQIAELTKQGKNVEAMSLLLEVQKQMAEQLQADASPA